MTTFVQVSPHFPESNVYFVEHLASAGVTVLGIGDAQSSALLPTMEEDGGAAVQQAGAVGEVCAHFYDIEGKPVSSSFDERIISVALEDLMRIPLRIGVAGTLPKLAAVRGAVKGGYVNALITDTETAAALCDEK